MSSLPALHPTVDPSAAQIRDVADRGSLVRGLAAAAEIEAFRAAIEKAVRNATATARALGERDTYGKAFLQVPNLCVADEVAKAFTFAPRFAKVAAQLLGVEGVRLYHDQALFKEPDGMRAAGGFEVAARAHEGRVVAVRVLAHRAASLVLRMPGDGGLVERRGQFHAGEEFSEFAPGWTLADLAPVTLPTG